LKRKGISGNDAFPIFNNSTISTISQHAKGVLIVNDSMVQEGFTGRCQKVLQVANDLHQRRPDWVTFFRETLGVNGAARSVFPHQDDYVRFEQSAEYAEIQGMVAGLRNAKIRGGGKDEATRVITVRLPESLHEALKAEAADHKTSMNKLCISKLLQVLLGNETEPPKSAPRTASTPPPAAPPQMSRLGQQAPMASQSPNSSQVSQTPQSSPNFRSTYQQPEQPNQPGFPGSRGQ
jgi:predicted HicB family RNase H-like nuclease